VTSLLRAATLGFRVYIELKPVSYVSEGRFDTAEVVLETFDVIFAKI
jgi:hypothetical protein